jgi:hypothetical protein
VIARKDCRPLLKRPPICGLSSVMETPKRAAVFEEIVPADGTIAAR